MELTKSKETHGKEEKIVFLKNNYPATLHGFGGGLIRKEETMREYKKMQRLELGDYIVEVGGLGYHLRIVSPVKSLALESEVLHALSPETCDRCAQDAIAQGNGRFVFHGEDSSTGKRFLVDESWQPKHRDLDGPFKTFAWGSK